MIATTTTGDSRDSGGVGVRGWAVGHILTWLMILSDVSVNDYLECGRGCGGKTEKEVIL